MPKNFAGETFSVSLISVTEKFCNLEGYVTVFDFLSKIFCLTVPKNFVGEPFGVSEIFWYRKILCFRRLCQDFHSKKSCLTVPKNFAGETFSVSLISVTEKFCNLEGYVTVFDFLSKIFCFTVPKNFVGEPFGVSLISGIGKVYA